MTSIVKAQFDVYFVQVKFIESRPVPGSFPLSSFTKLVQNINIMYFFIYRNHKMEKKIEEIVARMLGNMKDQFLQEVKNQIIDGKKLRIFFLKIN